MPLFCFCLSAIYFLIFFISSKILPITYYYSNNILIYTLFKLLCSSSIFTSPIINPGQQKPPYILNTLCAILQVLTALFVKFTKTIIDFQAGF